MKVENGAADAQYIEVPIKLPPPPEGFEYSGEYRPIVTGEYILDHAAEAHLFEGDRTGQSYFILRKKKPVRWRAEKGEYYFTVGTYDGVFVYRTKDLREYTDEYRYLSGNYFRTKEEAEAAAKKVRQVFQDIMEEKE